MLLICSFLLQPQGMSLARPAPMPFGHRSTLSANPPLPPDPFAWTTPSPDAPFVNSRPGPPPDSAGAGGWPAAWQSPFSPRPLAPIDPPLPFDRSLGVRTGVPGGALPAPANARGNCVITGEVSDAVSLNPIPGVLVAAVGSERTVETDAKGRFTITDLPARAINLEATKLGYFTETTVITTLEGQPAEARLALRAKPADDSADEFTLEEETVVGEYLPEAQGGFDLTLGVDSPALTSAIDREEFAKTAVSDAGEALAKVSGANIVDGKYAVVRGLADRYVTTLFNGAQVASADPSRKAIQLDLFPTSALEAIAVDKTYSPHLPGDFGGGNINIITRAFPEERILSYKFKINYNDSLEDRIYVNPNHSLGFFGDPAPAMPSYLLEETMPDGTPNFLDSADLPPDQLKLRWQALNQSQNLKPKQVNSDFGYSHALTYGETFKLSDDVKLGFMTALSESSGDESNSSPVTNPTRTYFTDQYKRSAEWAIFSSAALEFTDQHRLQATYFNKHIAEDIVRKNYRILEDTENLNYGYHLKNNNADINSGNDYGADAIYYGQSWDIEPLVRDLEIIQLKGSHKFLDKGITRGITLDWAFTDSDSLEERPHSSHFEHGLLDFTGSAVGLSDKSLADMKRESDAILEPRADEWALILMNEGKLPVGDPSVYNWDTIKTPWTTTGSSSLNRSRLRQYNTLNQNLVILNESLGQVETAVHGTYAGAIEGKQYSLRRTESTTEDATNEQLGVKVPFHFSDSNDERLFELSFGAANLEKNRESRVRAYDLYLRANDRGYPAGTLEGPGGLGEQIADDPSAISDGFTGDEMNGPYYTNALALRGVENINTTLEQEAVYLNGRFQYDKTFLSYGARWETESYGIDIKPAPESAFTDEQIDLLGWEERDAQDSFLPALSTGTTLFDDRLDLLFAWSRTVARPTFWEFVPTQTLDQGTGLGRRGNNLLTNTEIENFDLAFAIRPTDHSIFRFSFFDKTLDRPLVTFFETGGVLVYKDSYIRLDNDTGEIAEQRDYSGTVRGIEIEAQVDEIGPFSLKGNLTLIDAELNYFYEQAGVISEVTSQLPYQPSVIANATLGYAIKNWNATINLVYNYTGEYPVVLKRNQQDIEVSREAISTLDLILEKKFERAHADYTLRAGVKNILGATDTYRYGEDIFNQDTMGRTFWLEAEIAF
jgi:hypothetical protein